MGITGTLQVDAWTDRMTKEEKSSVKIVVKQLDILETRAEAELRQNRQGSYNPNNNQYGGNSGGSGGSGGNDNGDGPSSAGTGGFFDD